VPDKRTHRGAHPEDIQLFAPEIHFKLAQAVGDLCWLFTRGYASDSSVKLVGDRYSLVTRQRVAIARCSCSDDKAQQRYAREIPFKSLEGRTLLLDGYNVLTTIEAALAGGVILAARDGTYRDMASMHGSYRKVAETIPALELLGSVMEKRQIGGCLWYLDRPVSNSGRLKTIMEELASSYGWPWRIELVPNPDALLAESSEVVATADSVVLDRCSNWCNLAHYIIKKYLKNAWIVDLSK
jgi:hypothetical protein